jgi:hypothetical protein
VNLTGKPVRGKPLDHRIGIEESLIDAVGGARSTRCRWTVLLRIDTIRFSREIERLLA